MKKIFIKIKNNTLVFKEKIKLSSEYKKILDTNIINNNEILFSEDYINNNLKTVQKFMESLCKEQRINTIIIDNFSISSIAITILKNNKNITALNINDDASLTFNICELLANTSIKYLNCYNIQPFMLEYLDKLGIIVESRNEILFMSNFMLNNNLNSFSSLFYKITLTIDFPTSNEDEEDFITFCKINKYLKNIHVNKISLNELEFIVKSLKKYNKKNISIHIHDDINDLKLINYLKKFNKSKRNKNIKFNLDYTPDYIKSNIIKQTNSKILKTCGFLILLIIVFTFGYVFYDNYTSMQNVTNIQESINKAIEITDISEIIENLEANTEQPIEKPILNEDILALTKINPETVAWLKVNNTNIDYPVVKGTDNSFYLKHNIYLEEDYNGWVFMDYRNDQDNLNDNTIIYAHNRYYSGVMFGTLQNVLRYNWYTNEENQIISLRTIYENLEFQIFSIYKIYKTNDYMSTLFSTETVKQEFFNTLKNRSIYDFGITPSGSDKIITLSTCADTNNRIVVHAVLKNKSNN